MQIRDGTKQLLSKQELAQYLNNRVAAVTGEKPHGDLVYNAIITDVVKISQKIIAQPGYFYVKRLVFQNCYFEDDVEISHPSAVGVVSFINCYFQKNITTHWTTYSFRECFFGKDLTITFDTGEELSISEYTVLGELTLKGNPKSLVLRSFNEKQPGRRLTVRMICGDFGLQECRFEESVFQSDSVFERLSINSSEIANLHIEAITCKGLVSINESSIETLEVDSLRAARSLQLYKTTNKKFVQDLSNIAELLIIEGSFKHLELFGRNKAESIVSIDKAAVDKLYFKEIFNKGWISIKAMTVREDGLISFLSANMGKADFIYCDFSKGELEFENSKLTEVFLSETEFPRRVFLKGKRNYAQAQLAFGQLATASQKQGDTIRSLEFSSREIYSHFRKIRWPSKDFFTKFNLALNFVSNNFGRSWSRGILFTLSIGLIGFSCLLSTTNIGLRYDSALVSVYIRFMNPLRFFELEQLFDGLELKHAIRLNTCSYLVDFLGRIFIAYGYYQTIQAFRRFGRS